MLLVARGRLWRRLLLRLERRSELGRRAVLGGDWPLPLASSYPRLPPQRLHLLLHLRNRQDPSHSLFFLSKSSNLPLHELAPSGSTSPKPKAGGPLSEARSRLRTVSCRAWKIPPILWSLLLLLLPPEFGLLEVDIAVQGNAPPVSAARALSATVLGLAVATTLVAWRAGRDFLLQAVLAAVAHLAAFGSRYLVLLGWMGLTTVPARRA